MIDYDDLMIAIGDIIGALECCRTCYIEFSLLHMKCSVNYPGRNIGVLTVNVLYYHIGQIHDAFSVNVHLSPNFELKSIELKCRELRCRQRGRSYSEIFMYSANDLKNKTIFKSNAKKIEDALSRFALEAVREHCQKYFS